MAALGFFLTLAVCVLLGNMAGTFNNAPCQPSRWSNGHSEFVRRHILRNGPTSLDQYKWQTYITKNKLWDRPTQSFLQAKDKDSVNNVCSPRGGRTYRQNLCISNKVFTFVIVRIETKKRKIKSVKKEKKRLILACDLQDNRCLPVHFQGNPSNVKPAKNATYCQAPIKDGVPSSLNKSWLPLLSVLLLILYVC